MILNSLDQVRSIVINTIFGTEKAIVFLDKTFVDHQVYNSLNEAITECNKDSALGIEVLITSHADQFRVWVSIPEELILQAS
jgi:hypothetical protein